MTEGRFFNTIFTENYARKEKKASPFLLVCPKCGAIQVDKRWYNDREILESKKRPHKDQLCPGCEAIKNGWIEGEIIMKNKIVNLVPGQIENMIHNLENRLRHENPKNRIIKIQKSKNQWKVSTASVFLAHQIGKELEKTYVSKVSYSFLKGDKFVRVVWE